MRYPLWAFFFVLVMPPFAAHALLTGTASLQQQAIAETAFVAHSPSDGVQKVSWSLTSSRL